MTRRLVCCFVAVLLIGAPACTTIDLGTALEVTDVSTGWYDAGVSPENGFNHIVPSVSFRLRNKGTVPVYGVQISVAFWRDGQDGPFEEVLVRGIGSKALPPGASTEPILVRAPTGYNFEGARATFFDDRRVQDATARVFAHRAGTLVRMGDFKLERRIIPHAGTAGHP